MRIHLTIPGSPNPAFPSSLWRANLHAPLVTMGHDVVLFESGVQPLYDLDPAADSTREPRARFTASWRASVEEARRAAPLDLVLTYLSDSHLEPEAVREVRARVAPIVNFFCNNIHQFHLVKRIAPAFDLCLVPEKEAMTHYARAGAEALWWPMAANPETYRPLERLKSYDATFAGQRYRRVTAARSTRRSRTSATSSSSARAA
jgi:hypothetical protein